MVLHQLHQRGDGFVTEVAFAPLCERVGLVDQQHSTERAREHLGDLDGRLADVARHEPGPVGLDQLPPRDHLELPVELSEQPGDGCLARAGVAGEDEVAAALGNGQVALAAQPLDLQEVGDQAHLGLHRGQPDERVELGEDGLDAATRASRSRCRGRRRRRDRTWGRVRAVETGAREARQLDRAQQHRAVAVHRLELGVGDVVVE